MSKMYKKPHIEFSEEYNPFEPIAADNVLSKAKEEVDINTPNMGGEDNEEWEF